MKTQYCDECAYSIVAVDGIGLECKRGYNPRFFKPTENPHSITWGWKRKCADFVMVDTDVNNNMKPDPMNIGYILNVQNIQNE